MKNLSLKLFATLFISVLGYSLHAQAVQNIFEGDIKDYSVDTVAPDDPLNGTPGSTYTWTVFDNTNTDITAGGTLTITNQAGSTSGNRITIDWDTTPTGTYTLHVVETNGNCTGTEELITVNINPIGNPVLAATNVEICLNDSTQFTIIDAPANSTLTFNVTGGTATQTSPIMVDANGEATIDVQHDGTSAQIVVTITEMTLENGTVVDIDPDLTATTDVTIIETSTITFD